MSATMVGLLFFLLRLLLSPFRPISRLKAENGGTFLRNHRPQMAAMDLFVVPTIGFSLLYVLVIVRLARRELVWINVTAYPTANGLRSKLPKHSRGMTSHATYPRSRRDL
jgi:hypothetical protein